MLEDIGIRPQDVHDALRDGPVEFVVRSEVRRRRSLPPGHANRHSASDPDLSGLVARGHHDPPPFASFRVRAYNNGLVPEVRILTPLDADIECVHVHVENHTRHAAPSARRAKDLANRRGSLHTELVAFRILHDDAILLGIVPDALLRRPKSENPFDLGVDAFHPFLRRNLSSTGNVDIEMQADLASAPSHPHTVENFQVGPTPDQPFYHTLSHLLRATT